MLVNSLLGFSRIADFWSRGLTSFVGEARGRGATEEAATFVSTAVLSGAAGYAVLAAFGAIAIGIFATPLVGPEHTGAAREILPLMGVAFWLLAIAGIYQSGFLAFGRPGVKATQSIGGALSFLILALIIGPRYGLWGILVAQCLQGMVTLGFSIIAFHVFIAHGNGSPWQRKQFEQLTAYGGKAVAVGFLQLAIEPTIRLLAGQFGGLATVAAVELASRLIAAIRGMLTAVGQILIPEFARLSASADNELTILYQDASKLFLLGSLSAFSLLVSAGPVMEEIALGRSDTGFVVFLSLLSIGWFASTISSPAYFLLHGRRKLRPIFWSNFIMTAGAITLGVAGGLLANANGAMLGATLALVASSIYLVLVTGVANHISYLQQRPARLLPVLSAVVALLSLEASGLLDSSAVIRFCGQTAAIAATLVTCLLFGDIRGLVQAAARIP